MAFASIQEQKMTSEISTYRHSPFHLFIPNSNYIVTATTYKKDHIFIGDKNLSLLQDILFEVIEAYEWKLQAWALFPNHYHFIAIAPNDAHTLKKLIQRLHSQSAREVNKNTGSPGRKVWFQYWDSCLTYKNSYYARLNYVHNNPVRHGLVEDAEQYPFCSASWFKEQAEETFCKKIVSYPYDKINVPDDF